MNKNPLVSICVTFFSAERYIHRVIDSCLNQTYKNIEIVIVDDASIDGSEKVIKEYAARDSRIKYFKNTKRIGLALSLAKMFKFANGDFVMMIGADDWLARNYIENGARSFLEHPDAAGIMPKLVSLCEIDNDKFKFLNETSLLLKTYSTEWFVKRMYKPIHLYISALALIRKKDAVSAMDYFLKNYCYNQSTSISEELRNFFWSGFGVDAMLFLEILTRYKNFVFDNSLNYMKVAHGENLQFNLKQGSISEIFKNSYYYLLTFKYIYKLKWVRFYYGMKIFLGAETLSSAFICFFRYGFHSSLLNIKENKKIIYEFFNEFSFFEIMTVITYSILRTIYRCFDFIMRRFAEKNEYKIKKSFIFTQENFLDSEGRFKLTVID